MGNCLVCKVDGVEKETKNEALREKRYEAQEQKTPFRASMLELTGDHEVVPGLSYRFIKNKEENVKTTGVVPSEEEGVKRVRVVISKKQLVQLLSKCQGDLGSLVDVIGQLKSVSATVSGRPSPRLLGERWTPALEVIPEDV